MKEGVGSKEVHNLLASDFQAGQLPAGATGPQGATGAQGLPGISGLERVSAFSSGVNSNSPKTASAICPAGKRLLSGAGEIAGGLSGSDPNQLTDVAITEVTPFPADLVPGRVDVTAVEEEPTASNWSLVAHAMCANVN